MFLFGTTWIVMLSAGKVGYVTYRQRINTFVRTSVHTITSLKSDRYVRV